MARGGSSIVPGGNYHIIPRFVGGEWFIDSAIARHRYERQFGLAIAASDWRCYAFAIMSNHIHLGLKAGHDKMADWMRDLHRDFAEWVNARRERIGGVFVKGPNVHRVGSGGGASLISYIHDNPMRAGLVSKPTETDWTSHRAYVGLSPRPPWLDVELGLELAGFESGRALDEWMSDVRTTRAQLEATYVRRLPGRPRAANSERAEPSRRDSRGNPCHPA